MCHWSHHAFYKLFCLHAFPRTNVCIHCIHFDFDGQLPTGPGPKPSPAQSPHRPPCIAILELRQGQLGTTATRSPSCHPSQPLASAMIPASGSCPAEAG